LRGAAKLLLILLATIPNEALAFESSVRAMACCAKTDYACAGLQAPDDCCRQMGHGVVAAALATLDGGRTPATTILAVVPTPIATASGSIASVSATPRSFARLHDPPHLHPFPLLI
jgi:hypothetical protein